MKTRTALVEMKKVFDDEYTTITVTYSEAISVEEFTNMIKTMCECVMTNRASYIERVDRIKNALRQIGVNVEEENHQKAIEVLL